MESMDRSTKNLHDEFDPEDYLEAYYRFDPEAPLKDGYLKMLLLKLHGIFSTGRVKGNLLLDIGCGPTIHQHLSSCEVFTEIIVSDYCTSNLRYFERSLNNDPGTKDWTPCFKFVCELEGNSGKLDEKRRKLKSVVKYILKCDITKSNPFYPAVVPQADCVISFKCLSCASKDVESFRQIVKNVFSLLKVGGYLILIESLELTKYLCGGTWKPVLHLNDQLIREIVTDSGFLIEEHELFPLDSYEFERERCNYNTLLFLLARKDKDI
ncbi:nicotinamide N-methyltransferase-like [Lissotriton helveticus]